MWSGNAVGQTALKIGDPFPKFSLADLQGAQVTLPDDAAGKIAVIHFWASWCPLCIREMNAMQAVWETYREKGMIAYSIDVGETAEAARAYLQKTDAKYTIPLDTTSTVARQCGVNSIPTTFICDRSGKIRYKILGEINRTGLEKLVSTLVR
jgi:cytochrome c biogenesis protein CcmG, thiol:disulfide interchange protein DsbE